MDTTVTKSLLRLMLVLFFTLPLKLEAGLRYTEEMNTVYYQGDQVIERETVQTHYLVSDQALRIATTAEITIIRKDLGLIWTIYPDSTYTEMSFQDVQEMAQRSAASSTATNRPITVTQTDETESILGYPCTKYQVYQGDVPASEVWMTAAIPLEPETLAMFDLLKQFAPPAFAAITQLEGIPLRTKNRLDIETYAVVSVTEVTSIETDIIPRSAMFELPPRLTKIELSYQ